MIILEKDVTMAHLDNEIALLNIKNGKYFSLNETGARIWELLQVSVDQEQLISSMLKEYSVEEIKLRADIVQLLEKLKEAELIRIV